MCIPGVPDASVFCAFVADLCLLKGPLFLVCVAFTLQLQLLFKNNNDVERSRVQSAFNNRDLMTGFIGDVAKRLRLQIVPGGQVLGGGSLRQTHLLPVACQQQH